MKLFAPIIILLLAQSSLFAQVDVDSNKVDLRLNIAPGESYAYTTSTKQQLKQEIMGRTLEMNHEFSADYKYSVENHDNESIKIKTTYERIQLAVDSPEEQIIYDSQLENSDVRLSALNDLIDKPFYIFMDKNGKVVKVSGYEQLTKNIKAGKLISQFLTDSTLINSLNMDIYAGKPVSMGESWNKVTELNVSNMKLQNNVVYTLEGTSEDLVWLNVSGTVSGDSANGNIEVDLEGTQTGTIETDLTTGMISSGDITMEMNATLKSLDFEIPMKMTSETRISGRKL